jgi:hypothetical protein
VVVRIGERPIASLDDFRNATDAVGGESRVLLWAQRGGDLRFLLLKRGRPGGVPSEPASRADDAALGTPLDR